MPQRILHVVGRMDRAGAETLLMNLYREMDRTQFQFDFVYMTNKSCDFDDEITDLGGHIVRIADRNPGVRFLRLWAVLRKGPWSIIHAHTLFSSGLFLLAAMLAGVPKRVAHSHSTGDKNTTSVTGRAYQTGMRWLLSWVPTDYIACGKAASTYLFPGRDDVQIIANGININKFLSANRIASNAPMITATGGLVLLQVGRLLPLKNHAFSLSIAKALTEAGVDFTMLFVGTGPEQDAIEEIIKQYDLASCVRLLGLREDIAEIMAVADVLLMPSLYEGFPVVLVEAQAAGLSAVISSTISDEVDLGLGLVKFMGLDEPAEAWAASILAVAKTEAVAIETRKELLESRGFSAQSGAARLISIYVAQ